jgi:hypothetical protein
MAGVFTLRQVLSAVSELCPVLCPPPNPTKCDGVSRHRWKALRDKVSVALRHNS